MFGAMNQLPVLQTRKSTWDRVSLHRARAYILLETVVATGLLLVGLSVIGGQLQSARDGVREIEMLTRAMALAEQHLAELDLGIVKLESFDNVEEGDFGPRYPDWGWRLTTETTALENVYLLRVDVLYWPRVDEYREDDFDYDIADTLYTAYAMRQAPLPLDLPSELGFTDKEIDELSELLDELGLPGLEGSELDLPAFIQDYLQRPPEEWAAMLPVVSRIFGVDVSDLGGFLPAGLFDQLRQSGVLDELLGTGDSGDGDGQGGGS